METRYEDNNKLIVDINKLLKGYDGYVQFSDSPLRVCDIFEGLQDIKVTPTDGFIYEAHFCNNKESIMIRQQNSQWIVSTTNIVEIAKEDIEFYAFEKTKELSSIKSNWVKMAQLWKNEPDLLCAEMEVIKLQKVVFAGFTEKKGESS